MKNCTFFGLILLCIFAFSLPAISQEAQSDGLYYEINRVYPYISITKDELIDAQSIDDFKDIARGHNVAFDRAWIKEYISVEIWTSLNGKQRKAESKSDVLSQEQKDQMRMADAGSDIVVKVNYIPENTLTINEPKALKFTLYVDAASPAIFPDGRAAMMEYLQEKAIDKISSESFKGYDISAVEFSINERGEVINAEIFDSAYQSNTNAERDEILVQAIREMPNWKPAEYADGTKAKQDFVFTVGNMENCITHLFGIVRD